MIDHLRLPRRVMLDNNVLGFVHGPASGRKEEIPSRELWDALITHKRDVLIAAPTLGESLRGAIPVPLVSGVEIIAFDRKAAFTLGTDLPMSILKQVKSLTGASLTHLKFDALILACAVRGTADVLVTYDPDMATMVKSCTGVTGKMKIVTPDYFQAAAVSQPAAIALVTP